jgi:hypothetical protein
LSAAQAAISNMKSSLIRQAAGGVRRATLLSVGMFTMIPLVCSKRFFCFLAALGR